ncbi:MAG: methyltransferase [Spirochaetales bacterium]|nr:methyltransferase [Spirochaetales bacterium]
MTGREKLKAALAHKNSMVPIDFGSNAVTGIHVSVVAELRDHYGLEKRPVKVNEPYQMLGQIDEDLKLAMGIDVDGIYPPVTLFGFRLEGWKEWRTPWGQEVLVSSGFTTAQQGSDTVIFPEGDSSVPPSGRMPESGYFFDSIVRQEPIVEEDLDPEDNLEEFKPISTEDIAFFGREIQALADSSRGSIANFGGTGLGDIALVPGPFMKHPKGIRDVTEWYVSTVTRQDYLHTVFEKQTDVALENLTRLNGLVGDQIEAMFLCGTDFGTQTSLFCSEETFLDLYAPYYRKMTSWIHENTGWKVFKHTCGAIVPLIERFIEVGFDILNPVQCSAAGMDPAHLKKTFGDRVTFWGGGVDTQKTLPFGTPEEVEQEVLSRLEIFAPGGGFVFNVIHNIQAKTPVASIVAMIDAVRQFNGSA